MLITYTPSLLILVIELVVIGDNNSNDCNGDTNSDDDGDGVPPGV